MDSDRPDLNSSTRPTNPANPNYVFPTPSQSQCAPTPYTAPLPTSHFLPTSDTDSSMSDSCDTDLRPKRRRCTDAQFTSSIFGLRHVSLLGSERSLSSIELCLTAVSHCFIGTFALESKFTNAPIQKISLHSRGTADLKYALDPNGSPEARFKAIEIICYVKVKEAETQEKQSNTANADSMDVDRGPVNEQRDTGRGRRGRDAGEAEDGRGRRRGEGEGEGEGRGRGRGEGERERERGGRQRERDRGADQAREERALYWDYGGRELQSMTTGPTESIDPIDPDDPNDSPDSNVTMETDSQVEPQREPRGRNPRNPFGGRRRPEGDEFYVYKETLDPSQPNLKTHLPEHEQNISTWARVFDTFEKAKRRSPVCNAVAYGVPLDLSVRVLERDMEANARKKEQEQLQVQDVYNANRKLPHFQPPPTQESSVFQARKAMAEELEREALVMVKRASDAVFGQRRVPNTEACFICDIESLSDVTLGPSGDYLMKFPGFELGDDRKSFKRKNPISFRVSNPATTGYPEYGLICSLDEDASKKRWGAPVETMLTALNHSVTVSACYRFPSDHSRVGLVENMGVKTRTLFDLDAFTDANPADMPLNVYALNCDIMVEDAGIFSDMDSNSAGGSDGSPSSALERYKMEKEKQIAEMFALIKNTNFVANSLSGKTKLTFVLRMDRE